MRISRNLLTIGATLATIVLASPAFAEEPDLSPENVQRCKAATVLVDLGRKGSGSGFLVHSCGLFVTNAHVVRRLPSDSSAKLVLNSGQTEQKTVTARVVLVDEDEDLALLKTDELVAAEPLPLSDDSGLVELARTVVFGYPFGTMLATGGESYPAISVNVGRISALRRDGAALDKIQIDAATNPGNSGGPLVDRNGKVIGIIVSGMGTSVNFAIPTAKLLPKLQQPVLSLHIPEIRYSQRGAEREFEVEVLPNAPIPQGAEVTVHFGDAGPARRSFTAVRRDGRLYIKAAPLAGTDAPVRVRVEAHFDLITLKANFDDCPIQIGERSLRLSEVRRFEKEIDAVKKSTTIKTTLVRVDPEREEYEKLAGKVSGLPSFHSKINAGTVSLEDADNFIVAGYDAGELSTPYEIVLSSQGKTTATNHGTIEFADPPANMGTAPELRRTYVSGRIYYTGVTSENEGGVHILPLVEFPQDVRQGTWERTGERREISERVSTKEEASAWCELPVVPKGDYSLKMNLTPKHDATGELLFYLPVGKSNALLHVDGAKGQMKLDLLEGKSRDGEGRAPAAIFSEGKKCEVKVEVEVGGERASVVATLDGGRPLRWWGEIKNLASPKDLPVAAEKAAVGHHGLEMTIQSIQLSADEEGSLRVLREAPGEMLRNFRTAVGRWHLNEPPKDGKLPSVFGPTINAAVIGAPEIGVGPAVLGTGAMRLTDDEPSGLLVDETPVTTKSNHPHRSISMWFRADAPAAKDQRQYLYDEGGRDKGFGFYLEEGTLFAGGWDINNKWRGTWFKVPNIAAGEWYHVALVLDGKAEKKEEALRFYVNGALQGTGFGQSIGAHEAISIGVATKTVRTCEDEPVNHAITRRQFAGMIDEVEIYNSVLQSPAVSILAAGRFGIGATADGMVSRPPAPPKVKPVVAPATPAPTAMLSKPAATPAPAPMTPAPAPIATVKVDRLNPATVEVADLGAQPLVETPDKASGMWERVAEDLRGATIFSKSNGKQPAANIKVIKAGRVFVACDYSYQGNSGGDWKPEVWQKEDFLKDGWSMVVADLKKWGGPEQVLFTKVLPEGTTLRLRCNKYQPPFVITFDPQ